eukprot:5644384-Alexandrium_andersonii.AAC.1
MDGIEEVRDEDVVIVGGRQGGLSAGSATSRTFVERLRQRTVHAITKLRLQAGRSPRRTVTGLEGQSCPL